MNLRSRIGLFTLHNTATLNVDGPAYVRSLGLDCFEPYASKDLVEPDLSAARRIREEADRCGVRLPCLSASVDLCGEKGASNAERLMRYADVCKEAGIPLLHHTLYHELNPEAVLPSFEDALEELVPRVREIYDYAESIGVKCVYEDQGQVVNGVERFGKFLNALDRPCGVVLDLGNAAFAGETAEAFCKAFVDRVVHVHVKDYLVRPYEGVGYRLRSGLSCRPAVLGQGDCAVIPALKHLMAHGYDGCFMLECEKRTDARAEFDEHFRVLCETIGA